MPSPDVRPVEPIAARPPIEAPATVEPLATAPQSKLSPSPPPLVQSPAPRISEPVAKKVDETVRRMPSPPKKDNPLGSILIIAALLLILAAAGGGIWLLLSGDETTVSEEEATPLEPSPTNPVERAKTTIATVPEHNLDAMLEVEATPRMPEASVQVAEELKPTQLENHKESVSQYLQTVHIGGLRTGVRARIMLDGKNYDLNDMVDDATGLTFIGTRDQKLRFKDRNGVIYVKSF